MQPRGIVAVEEVKLSLPQGEGELGQVLHDTHLQVLGGHAARDGLQFRGAGQEQVRLPKEGADGPAAAIVIHGRIPLRALQILGAVPPVLSQNISLGVLLADALPDFRPQLVG